jgi:uncharacterized membrane protein YqgA involved in biofilm formation
MLGILANVGVIILGGFIGSFLKKEISVKKFAIFGICVAIISLVSFIENVFEVSGTILKSSRLYSIIFSLVVGYFIGEIFKLEERVNGISKKIHANSGVVETTVFFAVGGLQISGPILLAVSGDSSLLFLKCAIDFPFAIMYGALFGKSVTLSAIPVGVIQIIIALAAFLAGSFVSAEMLAQLCAVGYVILFFSGFNMLADEKNKVKTVNMLPSIPLVIILNIIISLIGV